MQNFLPTPTKIKAELINKQTRVILQITHPMDSGRQTNYAGEKIPLHYIHTIEIYHKRILLINAQLNYTIAINPKWEFSFSGGLVGDEIKVRWIDNLSVEQIDKVLIS